MFTIMTTQLFVHFFQGLFMSTVRCMVCSKESRTFDTFSNLTLPLPPNASRCTLQVCALVNGKGKFCIRVKMAHQAGFCSIK